jgi:hypothetical protein
MITVVVIVLVLAFPHTLGAQVISGPPSILLQCRDRNVAGDVVGPSARARECTRQYCDTPAYQVKITAYAMNRRQSEADQKEALTCITRKEQDKCRH